VLAGKLLVTPSPGSEHHASLPDDVKGLTRTWVPGGVLDESDQARGVQEVWLVDVRDRGIEVCVRSGAGRVVRHALTWSAPDGDVSVHVELAALFSDIM
jgi:hypothetical protein